MLRNVAREPLHQDLTLRRSRAVTADGTLPVQMQTVTPGQILELLIIKLRQ